jgi:hypothetical protein
LRRVRTEVSRERDAVKGQVRGRIDWRLTFQQWAQSGLRERDTYIVSKPIKNYNIPENLVLKKTIATLKNLIDDEEVRKEIDRDYSWSQMLKNSRRCLHFILRNVYFLRIKDEKQIRISPRMKSIVRSSRKALYRDSCRIYEQYEKLFRKDPDRTELEQLLRETFIDPRNIDRLFELYCLFKILEALKEIDWQIEKISEIRREREETAILSKDGQTITVFYNVTEAAKLLFSDRTEPSVIKKAQAKIAGAYFGKEKLDTSRRPDIILEFTNENKPNYLVFEIKNTRIAGTIEQGVYQALHYLYDISLVRKRAKPVFGNTLGNGYNAAVIAYKFPTELKKDNNLDDPLLKVKIFESADLRQPEQIKKFLLKFIHSST